MIGRRCKHLTRENALSTVLGYTIGNDVSERTWQNSDRTLWRGEEHRHLQADGTVDRDQREAG